MRLPLDIEKLEEIERSINEERTEKERLEKKFETAKKENEARLRREEEEEKVCSLFHFYYSNDEYFSKSRDFVRKRNEE